MDIDRALDLVGGYRRWNISIFIALGISSFIPLCFQGLAIVFIGWEPPHHCQIARGDWVNETIPMEKDHNGDEVLSKCYMYANASTGHYVNETNITSCTNGWKYDVIEGEGTIVTEWDLVCDRNYMSEMAQIIYQVGCLVGEVVCSYLVDRFGRKHTHIWSNVLIAVIGTGIAFSDSYLTFSILRAVLGPLIVLSLLSGVTLMMEIFDSKRRTFAGIFLEMQWVVIYLLYPLFAHLIRYWRDLQIFISLCSIVWIVYVWILPESPQWLMANNRYAEAEKVLERIAKFNGVDVDVRLERDDDALMPKTKGDTSLKSSADLNPSDLFKDRVLRKHVMISSLFWFANSLVYYFLILNSPNMAANRFLSFFYNGLVEIPAYISAFLVVKRFGRRKPLCVYHILAGVALAPMVFIPTGEELDLSILLTIIGLIAKFGITGSFAVIILYSRELFPTNLRGTSSGFCNVLGRIGNMFAPFAVYLNKTPLYWLPSLLFAGVSIGVGMLVFTLPETGDKALPQTLQDVHNLYENKTEKVRSNKSNAI